MTERLPVKTLQLEQMAVAGHAEEPSVVASRMRLVFSTLEVSLPKPFSLPIFFHILHFHHVDSLISVHVCLLLHANFIRELLLNVSRLVKVAWVFFFGAGLYIESP